ncbi:MAG TPA: hypothetical protein VIW23_08545 [Candidatus Acidoferrum sp.]|jgi:hypothetical protein
METLMEQIATECFRQGKPLAEIIEGLVEERYNRFLNGAKALIREGKNIDTVRTILSGNDLPLKLAISITQAANEQVAKEIANEKQLREATETAIALFKNGCRFDSVVNGLQARGCTPDLADRVAKENQHHYR